MSSGRFNTGRAMLEDARERASRSYNDSDFKFSSWADGETKIIRLLHGIDEMYIFQHSCGAANFEISKTEVDKQLASGSLRCPICEKALNIKPVDEGGDVMNIRPGVISANTHSAASPSDGKRRTFVCLDGTEYPCPICIDNEKKAKEGLKGNPIRKTFYGAAVVREGKEERVMVSGIPTVKLVDVVDHMIENDKGEMVPEVILLSQSWSNFWSAFDNVMAKQGSVAYYDFFVTRRGEKLDTTYTVEKVQQEPTPLPFDHYAGLVPDIMSFLDKSIGAPAFFERYGWNVPGYVEESGEGEHVAAPAAEKESSHPLPPNETEVAPEESTAPSAFARAADLMSKYQQ